MVIRPEFYFGAIIATLFIIIILVLWFRERRKQMVAIPMDMVEPYENDPVTGLPKAYHRGAAVYFTPLTMECDTGMFEKPREEHEKRKEELKAILEKDPQDDSARREFNDLLKLLPEMTKIEEISKKVFNERHEINPERAAVVEKTPLGNPNMIKNICKVRLPDNYYQHSIGTEPEHMYENENLGPSEHWAHVFRKQDGYNDGSVERFLKDRANIRWDPASANRVWDLRGLSKPGEKYDRFSFTNFTPTPTIQTVCGLPEHIDIVKMEFALPLFVFGLQKQTQTGANLPSMQTVSHTCLFDLQGSSNRQLIRPEFDHISENITPVQERLIIKGTDEILEWDMAPLYTDAILMETTICMNMRYHKIDGVHPSVYIGPKSIHIKKVDNGLSPKDPNSERKGTLQSLIERKKTYQELLSSLSTQKLDIVKKMQEINTKMYDSVSKDKVQLKETLDRIRVMVAKERVLTIAVGQVLYMVNSYKAYGIPVPDHFKYCVDWLNEFLGRMEVQLKYKRENEKSDKPIPVAWPSNCSGAVGIRGRFDATCKDPGDGRLYRSSLNYTQCGLGVSIDYNDQYKQLICTSDATFESRVMTKGDPLYDLFDNSGSLGAVDQTELAAQKKFMGLADITTTVDSGAVRNDTDGVDDELDQTINQTREQMLDDMMLFEMMEIYRNRHKDPVYPKFLLDSKHLHNFPFYIWNFLGRFEHHHYFMTLIYQAILMEHELNVYLNKLTGLNMVELEKYTADYQLQVTLLDLTEAKIKDVTARVNVIGETIQMIEETRKEVLWKSYKNQEFEVHGASGDHISLPDGAIYLELNCLRATPFPSEGYKEPPPPPPPVPKPVPVQAELPSTQEPPVNVNVYTPSTYVPNISAEDLILNPMTGTYTFNGNFDICRNLCEMNENCVGFLRETVAHAMDAKPCTLLNKNSLDREFVASPFLSSYMKVPVTVNYQKPPPSSYKKAMYSGFGATNHPTNIKSIDGTVAQCQSVCNDTPNCQGFVRSSPTIAENQSAKCYLRSSMGAPVTGMTRGAIPGYQKVTTT